MGSPNNASPASPTSSRPDADGSSDGVGTYEKWLVRILLTLAFGLAFGIEGMTLIRSFVIDDESNQPEITKEQRAVLEEGDPLVPAVDSTVRVRRLRLLAADDAWTFVLVARPEHPPDHRYSAAFNRVTTTNGTVDTTGPAHTWAAGDTTSFTASWALPPGQRPASLTVTATSLVSPDSTVSATRTVDVGHVPVRRQRN